MAIASQEKLIIQKGNPMPLGISRSNGYINFAVVIRDALECELNIYKPGEEKAVYKINLDEGYKYGSVFCVAIKGINLADYEYDYMAMGKTIIDPYAMSVSGRGEWAKPLSKNEKKKVRGIVKLDKYNWRDDVNPRLSYDEMVMYKLHMRGYTIHASSRLANKGTFKGLSAKIDYLKELGINAVLLMPVYEFDEISFDKYLVSTPEPKFVPYDEFMRMKEKESKDPVLSHYTTIKSRQGIVPYKINYWGYGAQSFYMAPKRAYAYNKECPEKEYKDLIRKFHNNGIEVIMEMSFKEDISMCFIIDCLKYWVMEYHIDGFKISRNNIDIELIAKEPLLSDTKIISEGFDEYRVYGNDYSPEKKNLAVMNVEYMNCVRRYLKGDEDQVGDFSYRYRRNPYKTGIINYITDSNGFTLNDLYSYDVKHNEANGEENRDGNDYNHSWNCGVEGATRKRKVLQLRNKQISNALATLLLSQGTPMLLAGDEFGNSQMGNNNPYCQDNEISWINWTNLRYNKKQFEFVKELIQFRKKHKVFSMKKEARLMDYISCGYPDMSYHGTRAWYPDYTNYSRTLGIMLCDRYSQIDSKSAYGQVIRDVDANDMGNIYYVAYNMHWEDHEFDLPKLPKDYIWKEIYNSEKNCFEIKENSNAEDIHQKTRTVNARTIMLLQGVYEPLKAEAVKKVHNTQESNRKRKDKNEAVQNKKCKEDDEPATHK